MSDILNKLPKIKGNYRPNADLKNWFGVDSKAEILFRPANLDDLQYFLQNCPKEISVIILGAASNVIVSSFVKGVVIRLPGEFSKISHQDDILTIGAACLCGNAALYAKNAELANLEFFTGIPGAIGGAIAMNAGCYGGEIANILIDVKAIDYDGNICTLSNADCNFSYSKNELSKKYIFIEGKFQAKESTFQQVSADIENLNKKREEAQPIRAKTGGSTFKNPQDQSAWKLVDSAGCRGLKVGDAQISEKHCNFMINNGNAKAEDLIALASKVREEVKKNSGIDLEWEVKIIK